MQLGDYTVITGDIVRSAKLASNHYQAVMQQLESTLAALKSPDLPAADIFRGDSFQLICQSSSAIHHALQLKLVMTAAGSAVRLSIVRGPVEQLGQTIAQSRGTAFTLSGHQLDQMRDDLWQMQDLRQPLTSAEQLLLQSSAVLLAQLTARQASILLAYLQQNQPSHQQLAEHFAVSRVNITNLLKQAQYDLICAVEQYFRSRISNAPECP